MSTSKVLSLTTRTEQYQAVRSLVAETHDLFAAKKSSRLSEIVSIEKMLQDRVFRIVVVAMTSTGKSTFVNALLGYELMPVADEAKTALSVIVRPSDDAALEIHWADGLPAEIHPIDFGDTSPISERLEKLMGEEEAAHVERVVLRTPIEAFEDFSGTDLPEVEIIDTPGPTSAGLLDHREQAFRAIETAHAVIYLLDFKKPLQAADEEILSQIAGIWREQNRLDGLARKLFFALNRCDDRDKDSQAPEERAAAESQKLCELLDVEGLRDVRAVSAKAALYSRLSVKGLVQDAHYRHQYHRVASDLRFWAGEEHRDDLMAIEDPDAFLMAASGLRDLEKEIYAFLADSALRELAIEALDRVGAILKQELSQTRRDIALWRQRGEDIAQAIAKMRALLADAREKFQGEHGHFAHQVEAAGGETIDRHVSRFLENIDASIDDLLGEHDHVSLKEIPFRDLRALWKDWWEGREEQFSSRAEADARQRELAEKVNGVLMGHQGPLYVRLNGGLQGVARKHNRDHAKRMTDIARALERALDKELGETLAFDDVEVEMPQAPDVGVLSLGEIGIDRKTIQTTQKKRVKLRPWYFLWLFEVERIRHVNVNEDVYRVNLRKVLEGIREGYRAELQKWGQASKVRFVDAFVNPAIEHYEQTANGYVEAIAEALANHERESQEHEDDGKRVATLESYLDDVSAQGGRVKTIKGHLMEAHRKLGKGLRELS